MKKRTMFGGRGAAHVTAGTQAAALGVHGDQRIQVRSAPAPREGHVWRPDQ